DVEDWEVYYNPDKVEESFSVVVEDGVPALRSPGPGWVNIRRRGEKYEYFHLRVEAKFDPGSGGRRSLAVAHPNGLSGGLTLLLEKEPPRIVLKRRDSFRFDEGVYQKGKVEVRRKDAETLDLPGDAL